MKSNLKEQLNKFLPYNEQEERDKKTLLEALEQDGIFFRENIVAHFTASAWVVNKKKNKVLMAYHRTYDSWAWLGGHADGEENLLKVAIKEVQEESGLKTVTPVIEEIYSLEVLTVEGHMKNNNYVPSHLHLNVTYLLEGLEEESLRIKEDENSDLAWFSLDEALEATNEIWFRDIIYAKLNQKLKLVKN